MGSIDYENTSIIERDYVVAPYRNISFEQTITAYGFEHIQRFDALLFDQIPHFNMKGREEVFPIPKIPTPAGVENLEKGEDGFYEGFPRAVLTDRATEISVIDLHPNQNWSNGKFMGLRIDAYKDFIANQKLFCQRCNEMFGCSDCI